MKKRIILAISLCLSYPSIAQIDGLQLNTKNITVSGVSSGGYMANQFHIAHSKWVKGAGIISSGPYYCAQNSIKTALTRCVNKTDEPIALKEINQQISEWQQAGLIDELTHLRNSKVWLLHGNKDEKIATEVNDALFKQYQPLVEESHLTYVNDKPFAHHMPTLNAGHPCDQSAPPFIGKCQYDAAGEMLKALYGQLQPRVTTVSGTMHTIDQHDMGGDNAQSLAQEGYLYVPSSCTSGQTCNLHISFHGCNQNAQAVDKQYVENSGLNNWADNNNLVVLYPQTQKSLFMPLNPQACWDWWGYTDKHYATKKGQQIQAVKQIVTQLERNN